MDISMTTPLVLNTRFSSPALWVQHAQAGGLAIFFGKDVGKDLMVETFQFVTGDSDERPCLATTRIC